MKRHFSHIMHRSLKCVLLVLAILSVSVAAAQDTASGKGAWEKYKAGSQHKAYAVGKLLAHKAASWGYPTVTEAIRAAINACMSMSGLVCSVSHLNGEPYLRGGETTTVDAFRKYEAGSRHKAYAVGKYSTSGAASWGYPTVTEAIRAAIGACMSKSARDCSVLYLNGEPYDETSPKPIEKTQPKTNDEPTLASTGTGFFLSAKGQIITNAHVVDECRFSRILYQDKAYDVSLLEVDQQNDLALLQGTIAGFKTAQLEIDRIPRLGESVVAFGYPLSSVLSSKPKITDGILSSTAGLNDDSRYFQISAPIQPGNSGGPLLDKFGRVIGIVTAKLDDSWSIENTGSVPQNVNFALKTIVIKAFLDSNNIVINKSKQAPRQMPLPDIAEAADLYTVQVGCFK